VRAEVDADDVDVSAIDTFIAGEVVSQVIVAASDNPVQASLCEK